MKIKGNDYNFGRVVYLTLIRDVSNSVLQKQKITDTLLGKKDNITICFDPSREDKKGQLNTRIDFYVKHMGDAGVGNNGFYTIANIDVYNIGPALSQFLDAYNAYKSDGHFKDVNTKKYAVVLQVGYRGNKERTTIFAGHISSFVMERQQSTSTVDNIWHFFCQYPDAQQNGETGNNQAISGTDYSKPEYWNAMQSFQSWEDFLKNAIMSRKRDVYPLSSIEEVIKGTSFSVDTFLTESEASLMCPMPQKKTISLSNFNKYYKIEYRVSKRSVELPTVKQYWQQKAGVSSWNMDTSSLQKTVSNIARAANCHARVELDENTGIQTIYIYPAGWAEQQHRVGPADYIIVDYQNLRSVPQVSANMLQLDMIMEPSMRPGDTIELQISQDFMNKYSTPSFQPNFSMANVSTVFAGANFIGLANMSEEEKKRNAIASAGNIFNTQFIATIVEFKGSTHTAEWSTKVDCYGVVINGKEQTL